MRRGTLQLTASNLFSSAMLMVRAIVIAWLIPVADFGVASTYLMIVLFFDAISTMGLERMIVQDRDGDSEHMQAGLQAMQIMRGIAAALLMLALAGPIATLMGAPQAAAGYRWLALVPLLRSFAHFDQHRVKRAMDMGQASMVVALSSAASMAIVFIAAAFVRDDRIMLWSILGQQVAALLVSHAVAKRPYRLAWDPDLMRKTMRFGLPLMLNGLLMFVLFNGERVIVGRELGMEQLAIFTMMLNLVMTPMLVMGNVAQTVCLSELSRLQGEPEPFARMVRTTLHANLAIGLVAVLAVAFMGPPVVGWLTGPKYHAGLSLLVVMAICQAVRLAKSGAATGSMALAKTGNALIGNLFWMAALPFAWWWTVQGGTMMDLVLIAIAAETLALAVSIWLAGRATATPLAPAIPALVLATITFALVGFDLVTWPPSTQVLGQLHLFQIVWIAAGLATIWAMGELVQFVKANYLKR